MRPLNISRAETLLVVLPLWLVAAGCTEGETEPAPPPPEPPADTTVLLVRHAEKMKGDDPHLTEAGGERARALVDVAGDAGVTVIVATETCRTVQTAQPLASTLGLPIHVVDFGPPGLTMDHCALTVDLEALPATVDSSAAVAAHLLAEHRGATVLVAGHSNTVPEIVEALGAGSLCPDYIPLNADGNCHIPDEGDASDYDNLFVVEISGKDDSVRIVKAKYGEPSPPSP